MHTYLSDLKCGRRIIYKLKINIQKMKDIIRLYLVHNHVLYS